MNLSKFFIDRPIFAGVISVIIFLTGLVAMPRLPISEYPEVVPPSVVVTAQFPGANPQTIAETVATPLEEQINGTENMLYMGSSAASDGTLTLTATFKLGTDPNLATQLVQNRVNQALPRLPEVTRALGITTVKSSPDLTMVVHLKSPTHRYDMLYLRNYAVLNVKDQLAKIEGVGSVQMFGSGDYAMRLWLNPQRIAELGLTAHDVIHAVRKQNVQVAAGVINGPPYGTRSQLQLPINVEGRLSDPAQFKQIVIKNEGGVVTRLGDVARVEIDASQYGLRSLLNNDQAVAIPVFQAPGSNAIQISDHVRATMEELKKNFPEGLDYSIVYDPTVFVRDSIKAVIHTLLEGVLLGVLVVILFLQTWRASIIPLLAVPISIIGPFGAMLLFGFSINNLSLFGLVLAIGIVVDDAIVVVENVERNIEAGLAPREATLKAMSEVTGPIIAIALVLCAVFVPIAFISGLTGEFYRQFAMTIAFSTVISAFNSLTLSPALSALLLKPHGAAPDAPTRVIERLFGWLFRHSNRLFARASESYGRGVAGVIRKSGIALAVYAGLIVLAGVGFARVPTGFVPTQDKGYLIAFAQLPDAATLDRTESVIRRMSAIGLKHPGVANAIAFPGLSINGFVNSPNAGIVFFGLENFEARKGKDGYGPAIAAALNQEFGSIQDAYIAIFPPPPVQGLGTVGGFKMEIEDRAAVGEGQINKALQELLGKVYQTPVLAGVFSGYQTSVPQLSVDVDREKVKRQGIALTDVFQTLQVYLGSAYVNDFSKFGRTYRVVAQADAPFRATSDGVGQLEVRNARGEMVPLSSVLTVRPSNGPDRVVRYNAYPAAEVVGGPAPGVSSGQAVATMEQLAKETLPNGVHFEWTELTYQQILSGNTALYVFPLCVLLAFLVLAAQYESWSLPLAVILIVPMGLLSALAGVWLSRGDNNIFTQIGFIVLVGLACKNAILIVEFARELQAQGRDRISAALEACRLRLRPILMTSLAFIMGVVPLMISKGAGAEMRQAMGVAVFSGMIGVTVFGLILTPVFYVVLRKFVERRDASAPPSGTASTTYPPAGELEAPLHA